MIKTRIKQSKFKKWMHYRNRITATYWDKIHRRNRRMYRRNRIAATNFGRMYRRNTGMDRRNWTAASNFDRIHRRNWIGATYCDKRRVELDEVGLMKGSRHSSERQTYSPIQHPHSNIGVFESTDLKQTYKRYIPEWSQKGHKWA